MRNLFFLFFLFSFLYSPAQEYKFNVFTQEEGLPQPYVYDIAQSEKGFLFLATGDGLGMYGGTKFKKATIRDGLAENFCNSLFMDSRQRLWVGHFEGGVSYTEKYQFKKIDTKNTLTAKVIGFAEDKAHTIYYANSAGGLYTIRNNSISAYTSEHFETINDIKIQNEILYVASQAGLIYFDLKDKKPKATIISETENRNVVTINFLENNELVLGVDGEGIEIYTQNNHQFQLKKTITQELNSLRKNIKDVLVKPNNELYVSLNGEGIKIFNLNTDFSIAKQSKIDAKNGLKNLFINKLFIDSETNLWLGSYGGGLFQMASQRFELYNKANVLPFENIKTLAIGSNNEIILTNEKQLFILNLKSEIPNFNNELLNSNNDIEIRTSYYNPQTKIVWIGTTSGVFLYDILSGVANLKMELPLFKNKTVNYITQNKLNEIIVCTTEGLFILDTENKLIKYYSTDTGLPHNNITGCFIDSKNHLWVFSPETPLYKIHNDSIEMVREIDTVNSYQFNNAVQDTKGNIWFGTNGGGIYKYMPNKKVTHYTTENGLNSDFVYSIILTNKNDVIAGHKNGLSIKYSYAINFKPITKSLGLQATNVNSGAMAKGLEGNIWIGTTEGLIKYNPLEDKINPLPPILSLLQIKFNNKRFDLSDTIIELSYNNYELDLDYIGISLSNPTAVTYKYKLEGYNQVWQSTDEVKLNFPKLDDGEYRLLMYATNGDGVQTQSPITFKIIIHKPYWKAIWFYLLCFTFVSGIWYIIYRIRTQALFKIKAQLEKMVTIKTSELVVEKERVEKINELLEEKNHDITDSIAYAQRIQRAILPSLDSISKKTDTFVFYQARDIVSGDFYWYHETEQFYYIAAVDCTGHGVPGAFMSLLGGTYLDQIMIEAEVSINSDKTISPAQILTILDSKIFNSFRNTEENGLDDGDIIRDGMDIAICKIDKNNKKIVCSNAGRPVYIISKGELTEVKSNNIAIGGKTNTEKQFIDTEINYEIGDCFYIFSDGFCDQFGGEKNKRYTTKRLKELLLKIANLETSLQFNHIKKEFDAWKGNADQTDDVILIGIKF